jgi:hypothetical protein
MGLNSSFRSSNQILKSASSCSGVTPWRGRHTGWKRLLQLLGLLGILQDKSVQVSLAADLELDVGGLLAALYASSCFSISLIP